VSANESLRQFVDAANARGFVILNEILSPECHGYAAQRNEPTAPETMIAVAEALAEAYPNFVLQLMDVIDDRGEAQGPPTSVHPAWAWAPSGPPCACA